MLGMGYSYFSPLGLVSGKVSGRKFKSDIVSGRLVQWIRRLPKSDYISS